MVLFLTPLKRRSAMKQILKTLLITAIIAGYFLFPMRAAAQTQKLRFERLGIEQGLSQNAVLTIAQDTQGFLWIGTEDGLNKYDGYQFTVYKHDPDDPTSLIDNYVSEILVDLNGEIWIGTRSGLDRYDPSSSSFIHYPTQLETDPYLQGAWVISLYEDHQGTLWVGTEEEGLNRLDRSNGTFSNSLDEAGNVPLLHDNAARVIFEDTKGEMWIGTHDGMYRFDRADGEFTQYNSTDDAQNDEVNDISEIYEDRYGNLWVGSEAGGISRFDPASGSFTRYIHDPDDPLSLSHDRVRAIYQDRPGNFWVGTQNGLNLVPAEDFSPSNTALQFLHYYNDSFDPASLGSSTVWSIFEDQSGVMWFGTWGGGLSKYNRSTDRFKLYQHDANQPDSLSDNMIWAIMQASDESVWVGTFNGGLNVLDREMNEIVVYRHDESDADSLLSDDVRALLEDPSGRIWVGTAGGLELFDSESDRFIHFTTDVSDPHSLSGNRVNVLRASRSGGIWVGTRYSGLNLLEPASGKFTRYRHDENDPSSLGDDRIWALYEDEEGALWVGTLSGISVLQPGSDRFIHYRFDAEDESSLSSDSIFAFYEDPQGTMWVGTWGGGLDRFDRATGRFEHFTERDGLPNDTIYGIEADASGGLWMSTNRGLSRFDPQSETFENYDVRDGLQDNEFNVGAHFRSGSGEMFFGGIRGFNAFFPDEIQRNPHVPPIVITTFYKFNQAIRHDLLPNEQIQLSYRDNFIAFDFAALDYYAPANNQYAYMLEGFDEDWVQSGTRRYVSYTNLAGGTYVFRVRGSNSDGVWNEEGVSVLITVTPPFWETAWFQVLGVLVFAALVFTGFRWNVRRVEARSRELEKLVSERTQEIEQRRSEINALYLADEKLMRHLEVDQVFQALVEITVEILHADKGLLLYWDESAGRLKVRASKGFKAKTLDKLNHSVEGSTAEIVMQTGKSVVIRDVLDDTRVNRKLMKPEGILSLMRVPIQSGDRTYGVLTVAYTTPQDFGGEQQRLFEALAQRAAIAIEQANLQDQAQKSAVYEERQRLARDLHDAVTQTLFSASLVSEVLPTLWEKDPELGRSRLKVLNDLTKGALAEMRTLLFELRPSALASANLDELMRQLADSLIGRARIPVDLEIEGNCEISPEAKVVFYRVAQEALNNVAKHAQASRVRICLRRDGSETELIVEDDGIGFDPKMVSPDHLGLRIMQERAESIGARLHLEPGKQKGTRLSLAWDRK